MNAYLTIIAADLKNTRRDPTLLLIFWVPVLLVGVVRFGFPLLESYLPDARNYAPIILGFFVLLNAVFPGFILSFILLDEKDLHLLPVLTVTPVSLSGFLMARMLFMVVFGLMGSLLLFLFNGIIQFPILEAVSISLLSALNAPILILLITSLARNKVEGLTLLKVANVSLFIPMVIFFMASPWEYLLGIFPAFWVYKYMDTTTYKGLVLGFGILVLALFNYLIYKYADKKLRTA